MHKIWQALWRFPMWNVPWTYFSRHISQPSTGRAHWKDRIWYSKRESGYSTVGCRRTGGRRSQPGSFLFFTTPASLVLIFFQSVFESRRLDCSAHTVRDDACRAGNAAEMFQTVEVESFRSQQCRQRSRLHSKYTLFAGGVFQPWVVLIFRWNSSLAFLRQTGLWHPTVL